MALSNLAERYFGPQVASVSPGAVWTYSQSTLWRLSLEGKVTGRYSAKALGIGPSVEMLAALNDNQVAVRDFRSKSWQLCGVGAGDVVDLPCRPLFPNREASNKSQAAIAVTADGERWAFADFDSGEVLLLDKGHNIIATARGPVGTEGGNAVWLPGKVLALMATDNAKLQRIDWSDEARPNPLPGWALTSPGKSGQGYVWSAAYDEARSRWLLSYGAVRRATHLLWKVDDKGTKTGEISLGSNGEPAQIVMVGKDLAVVPDAVRGKVYRIDLATDSVSEFGEESFRKSIRDGQQKYDLLDNTAQGAMYGMFVFPLLIGFLFVEKDNKGKKFVSGSGPTPLPTQGELWLAMNPEWEAMNMRLFWIGPLLIIGLLAAMGHVLKQFTGSWVMTGVIIVPVALAILAGGLYFRAQFRKHGFGKLGVNATSAIMIDWKGQQHVHPFAEIVTDGTRLLIGKRMLMLKGPASVSPWLPDDLNDNLLQRLPKSSWVSAVQLEKALYGRNKAYVMLFVAIGVVVVVALIAVPIYTKLQRSHEKAPQKSSVSELRQNTGLARGSATIA